VSGSGTGTGSRNGSGGVWQKGSEQSRGIRQWEGGSWTSLMRVSARSTPTGRHSGGLAAAARQVVEIRYTCTVFNHN
jgi:hypothetical protein